MKIFFVYIVYHKLSIKICRIFMGIVAKNEGGFDSYGGERVCFLASLSDIEHVTSALILRIELLVERDFSTLSRREEFKFLLTKIHLMDNVRYSTNLHIINHNNCVLQSVHSAFPTDSIAARSPEKRNRKKLYM